MEIKVTQREVYGNSLFYPANDKASTLALLTNSKTLTRRSLQLAQELGFKIVFSVSAPSTEWLVESDNTE